MTEGNLSSKIFYLFISQYYLVIKLGFLVLQADCQSKTINSLNMHFFYLFEGGTVLSISFSDIACQIHHTLNSLAKSFVVSPQTDRYNCKCFIIM